MPYLNIKSSELIAKLKESKFTLWRKNLENEAFKKSVVFLFLFISPEPDHVEKRVAYQRKDDFVSFSIMCSTLFYIENCSHGD